MRIVVLVDDSAGPGLRADHGLSIYVDSGRWRALFDADSDPAVLEFNARALGVDLSSLDFAVLSHHHLGHVGGFLGWGLFRRGLRVYAPPGPVERLEAAGLEPVVVESTSEVAPGAHAVGPLESRGFSELALALDVGPGERALLVGCGHPGVGELASRAVSDVGGRISLIAGGFHAPPRPALDRLAGVAGRLCPGHCSGDEAREYLRARYPERYCEFRSGLVMELRWPAARAASPRASRP
ncbi:MAG: MBL fold metallo-hydrolase [Nitrososphaeria archaeon]